MQIAWLPTGGTREKIFGLDAFRGLAALLVFLFHYWTWYLNEQEVHLFGLNLTALFAAGHLGVDIFFVLSGFLIFLSLVGSPSLREYLRRRLLRIIPLAWAFSLILFFLEHDFSHFAWLDLGAHLLFLQGFFQSTYHGLNPVMWTVSVEMLFYLSLPLLLFLGRKKLWHFLGILLILTILNFWYRFHLIQFFPQWSAFERIFYSEQLWGRFDQFALGISLGLLWLFRAKISDFVQKISSILLLIGLSGFFLTANTFSHFGSAFRDTPWMQIWLHALVGLSVAIFFAGFLFAPPRLRQVLAPSFLMFTGLISYSLYLWHFPILAIVHRFVPQAGKGFMIALILTFIAAALSFFCIEKPFLKRKVEKGTGIP